MPPKKDPNKPKGRTTAYAFYLKEKRQESRTKGENVEFTAFSKECATAWAALSDEEKQQYFKMADEDKQRFEEEMSDYVPPDGYTIAKKGKRLAKKPRDPNRPKRAM